MHDRDHFLFLFSSPPLPFFCSTHHVAEAVAESGRVTPVLFTKRSDNFILELATGRK